MENKKKEITENPMETIQAFVKMISRTGLGHFFTGMPVAEKEKYPFERLGNGYELIPIKLSKKEQENSRLVSMKYSHLYHNGLKVTDLIFRSANTSQFKDGYCKLIHYVRTKEKGKNSDGFSFGTQVIINHLGEIAMSQSSLDYPTHIGGNIASIGNYIYDLRSGKAIAPKSSTTITGASCIIIEHRYSWYDKEAKLPLGIYKIEFDTAKITLIDNVQK